MTIAEELFPVILVPRRQFPKLGRVCADFIIQTNKHRF